MDIVLYCLAIVIAAVITGLLGYFMVPFLHKIKFGQTIREVGPSWHKNKQGTPTMGGIMFIIGSSVAAVICIAFLWLNGGAETQLMFVKVVAGALMAVGFGIVGFLDDYISIKKHRNLGLTEIQKLILQFIIVGAYLLSVALAGGTTETVIPFLGSVDLGFFYYILAAVFIVGMVNAVNFTGDHHLDLKSLLPTFPHMEKAKPPCLSAQRLSFYYRLAYAAGVSVFSSAVVSSVAADTMISLISV